MGRSLYGEEKVTRTAKCPFPEAARAAFATQVKRVERAFFRNLAGGSSLSLSSGEHDFLSVAEDTVSSEMLHPSEMARVAMLPLYGREML